MATSQLDGITEQDSTIAGSGCTASDGARPGAIGDNSSMENAQQGVDGVRDVLDETWDTAESPNFAAALQARTRAVNESLAVGGVVTLSRVDLVVQEPFSMLISWENSTFLGGVILFYIPCVVLYKILNENGSSVPKGLHRHRDLVA